MGLYNVINQDGRLMLDWCDKEQAQVYLEDYRRRFPTRQFTLIEPEGDRFCVVCGHSFIKKQGGRITCSKTCADTRRIEREKNRYTNDEGYRSKRQAMRKARYWRRRNEGHSTYAS